MEIPFGWVKIIFKSRCHGVVVFYRFIFLDISLSWLKVWVTWKTSGIAYNLHDIILWNYFTDSWEIAFLRKSEEEITSLGFYKNKGFESLPGRGVNISESESE